MTTEATTKPELNYSTPDSKGYVLDAALIGKKFRHYRNAQVYTVVGHTWCGECDEWGIVHERPGSWIKFTRPASNFFEEVAEGVRRFQPLDKTGRFDFETQTQFSQYTSGTSLWIIQNRKRIRN